MTKLALDLGTTTGFAWLAVEGVVVSGTWDLRPKKYEGGGHRYLKFRAELDFLHLQQGLQRIWFEAVRRHMGTDAAHVYGGLMATLQAWCEEHQVPYEGVPVGTIKKFWTGSGAAKKASMIQSARDHGYSPVDDNEADALALLHLKLMEIELGHMPVVPVKAKRKKAA